LRKFLKEILSHCVVAQESHLLCHHKGTISQSREGNVICLTKEIMILWITLVDLMSLGEGRLRIIVVRIVNEWTGWTREGIGTSNLLTESERGESCLGSDLKDRERTKECGLYQAVLFAESERQIEIGQDRRDLERGP
jgi:hypothetical protein